MELSGLKMAFVGFGNVGKAVARVMLEKRELFQKIGFEPTVVGIFEKNGSWIDDEGLIFKEFFQRENLLHHGLKVQTLRNQFENWIVN
jgi:homoserine dehydrogenase